MAFYLRASQQHPFVPNQVFDEPDHEQRESSSGYSLLTPLSSHVHDDEQWTVFSPQIAAITSGVQTEEDEDNDEGTATPLAFPSHNGTGSFFSAGSELTDRVNAWRLDQSQLVLAELQRLEHKFFWATPNLLPEKSQSQRSEPKRSLWDRFMQDFVGLNDRVLDMLFGDRFFDERDESSHIDDHGDNHGEDDHEDTHNFIHYGQALKMGPPGWQERLIQEVLDSLNVRRGTDVKFLRYLGSRILSLSQPHCDEEIFYPKLRDVPVFTPTHNYWEDSLVSSNWEQSSLSTPVW